MSAKLLASVLTVGLSLGLASTSFAQCDFQAPFKAKSLKLEMVRSFSECPGITHASPNTSTGAAGTPACTAPVPRSDFRFGPKGSCKLQLTQKLEAPCKDFSGVPCANLTVKLKCKDLRDSLDVPSNGQQWAVHGVISTTTNDNSNGDMTLVNFPIAFAGVSSRGGLSISSDTNTLLTNLFGPGNASAGCTSHSFLSLAVHDPSGAHFAMPGTSTR